MYRSLKNKYLKYVFQQKQPLVYMYVRAGIGGSIKNWIWYRRSRKCDIPMTASEDGLKNL